MANISTSNSTYTTGGIDTRSTLDGTSQATFQQMNGAASAAIAVETILGDGPTLKGNKADLAVRLAEIIDADGKMRGHSIDSRTNTVADGATIYTETSSTPAAGIGTRLLFQAESQDENPADLVAMGGSFDDVGTGSEDSRFVIWLRVAGAALARVYEFVSTTTSKAIFSHGNSTDRTYTLINRSVYLGGNSLFDGPGSCASGSTRSHEGSTTISGNQNLSGIHFYTDFTLNSGVTITVPANKRRLVIIATGTITINGTINASGAGAAATGSGTDQVGGGGTQGESATTASAGGNLVTHGITLQTGGAAGGSLAHGTAGTQVSGSDTWLLMDPTTALGGAGGGSCDVPGGAGGGSIVLIAPTIVLASTATLNTSGAAGSNGGSGQGPGGGGGAGNIYIRCRSYTDSGATFTQSGGAGGSGGGSWSGGAGAAGVRQILIYA